jgi:hypothetical protein
MTIHTLARCAVSPCLILLCAAAQSGFASDAKNLTDAEIRARLHAPITAPADATKEQIFAPRPYTYVEPQALSLPSTAELKTITIRDREYTIRKTPSRPGVTPEQITAEGIAWYDKSNEALFFQGSGGGGLKSKERLIVENCAFVLDFQEGNFDKWDVGRCAIRVEGYNEVLIRNCVFVSRTTKEQEIRRTVASIVAYDCQKVQIEECFFAGRTTGWRGHVLVFCCGPTSIRNIEVRGTRQGDQWACGGGVWVATGVGEGKIGFLHADAPELMIYPPGPLLIENAWIHDQTGRENNDGIYIQSVQPFLVRNCKLENWRDDALMDIGFRDGAGHGKLVNHGGMGIVENCEFVKGASKSFVKNSVGAAGGIVFRNNVMRDIWVMPYVFDGGTWYFVGNEFVDLTGPAICGDDGRGGGWEPGMLRDGSRLVFFNNLFQARPGVRLSSLIRSKNAAPLLTNLVMDYNVYDLNGGSAGAWLTDDAAKVSCKSFEDWKRASGSDTHSIIGNQTLEAFKAVGPDALKLPGGVPMVFGPARAGLTGPVGVTNPEVLAKAKPLVEALEEEYAAANIVMQIESLPIAAKTLAVKEEERKTSGGYAWLALDGRHVGEAITFTVTLDQVRRYDVNTGTQPSDRGGLYQVTVNGQKVGEPTALAKKGSVRHGVAAFKAGTNALTYTLTALGEGDGGSGALDSLSLRDADQLDKEVADAKAKADQAAAQKAAAAALEAATIKFAIADLPVIGKSKGHLSDAESKGVKYRLWQPVGEGDSVTFGVDITKGGKYAVTIATHAQVDKGQMQLVVDEKAFGASQGLGDSMNFGAGELSEGKHTVRITLTKAGNPTGMKVRLQRIDLVPQQAATQERL